MRVAVSLTHPWASDPADDPLYDKRTLFIPREAWAAFKPFEKQYWEIKSQLFDTIVFFKKGFFYELYEVDADIGVREFDLNYSKSARAGEMRLAGFPISRYEEWAAKVVARGYKVARVDELENSVTKAMREKKNGGKKVPCHKQRPVKKNKVAGFVQEDPRRVAAVSFLRSLGVSSSHGLLTLAARVWPPGQGH